MKNSMLNVDWAKMELYTEEDITYFLFLEGKSIECVCRVRNLSKETVQKHILDGKIKYGILAKSSNEKELFETISGAGKLDKIEVLKGLSEENNNKLVDYIRDNYVNMNTKNKENAVWILGELRDKRALDILIKACVHNHVNVRRMAVSAIGKIGDRSAENALMRTLIDNNTQVKMYTIKSLTKIKSEKAQYKVREIYKITEKEYIKRACEEYFEVIDNLELRSD